MPALAWGKTGCPYSGLDVLSGSLDKAVIAFQWLLKSPTTHPWPWAASVGVLCRYPARLAQAAEWNPAYIMSYLWKSYTELAWNLAPALAAALPLRFPGNDAVQTCVRELVQVRLAPACGASLPALLMA